jgi:Mg-chelatase subunit ChlD
MFSIEKTEYLDIVFCIDCTASMGPYIKEAKDTIKAIITKITEKSSCDNIRFGLVAYRDHPPEEKTFVTKNYKFTNQLDVMQENLDELYPQGGGDGPEALTSALFQINNLDWRYQSEITKIVILISDAPPHGLGESNDGFPNGDPDGHDPIIIARELATKGIVVYTVGCEPEINNYKFARAFLISIANLTGGQPISLKDAKSLADIILGSTLEELGITKLLDEVVKETDKIRDEFECSGELYTESMVYDKVHKRLRSSGLKTPQIKGCNILRDNSEGIIEKCENLRSASEILRKHKHGRTTHFDFESYSDTFDTDLSYTDNFMPLSTPIKRECFETSRSTFETSRSKSISVPKLDFESLDYGIPEACQLKRQNATSDKIEVVIDDISDDQIKRLITRASSM